MDAACEQVLTALGVSDAPLLGAGGEAWVFALDPERVLRVAKPAADARTFALRTALLSELARSAHRVPFAIPEVFETLAVEGQLATVERRLAGSPLSEALRSASGSERTDLIHAYLEAASAIGDLEVARPWWGDIARDDPIHTRTFRGYLEQRAARSLAAAGFESPTLDAQELASALPEPTAPAFVHLDAFPGNMLAEGGTITAVLDFGSVAFVGDRRLDPLSAVAYLDSAIAANAQASDRAIAHDWLAATGLDGLYRPAERWIAAFWSSATDDASLHSWCRAVLDV